LVPANPGLQDDCPTKTSLKGGFELKSGTTIAVVPEGINCESEGGSLLGQLIGVQGLKTVLHIPIEVQL